MLSVIKLNAALLKVVTINVFMPNVTNIKATLLHVLMPNAIVMSVVAPFLQPLQQN
jgi:hypothetical protein